jgi:hypothetical protein
MSCPRPAVSSLSHTTARPNSKEARRAKLRDAAAERKATGKDAQAFKDSEYQVGEESTTPQGHSRQVCDVDEGGESVRALLLLLQGDACPTSCEQKLTPNIILLHVHM